MRLFGAIMLDVAHHDAIVERPSGVPVTGAIAHFSPGPVSPLLSHTGLPCQVGCRLVCKQGPDSSSTQVQTKPKSTDCIHAGLHVEAWQRPQHLYVVPAKLLCAWSAMTSEAEPRDCWTTAQ